MQKIKVTGASDLALLFLHQGCFCIAYQYFLWVVSVTLCNNAYWIFETFQVRRCNQRAEINQLMCDIAVCIAKAQDNAEMDWHAYEIKLGTSTVSLSIVYCLISYICVQCFTSMCMCFLSLQTDNCAPDNLKFS